MEADHNETTCGAFRVFHRQGAHPGGRVPRELADPDQTFGALHVLLDGQPGNQGRQGHFERGDRKEALAGLHDFEVQQVQGIVFEHQKGKEKKESALFPYVSKVKIFSQI